MLEDNFMCVRLSAGKLLHVLGLRRVQSSECLVLTSVFVPCGCLSSRLAATWGGAGDLHTHSGDKMVLFDPS